ncbi:MAG: hypothetical protein KDC57_07450 [Saprospiraceae bacterium]|nr:hypothetical protein [Saprospiraceae bacterium]
MKILMIALFSYLSMSAHNSTIDTSPDGSKKICIYVFGRQTICVVVESSLVDWPSELKLEGTVDFKANRLSITDFPKDLNGKSFIIMIGENKIQLKEDEELKMYNLKAGEYTVRDGKTFIPFTATKR